MERLVKQLSLWALLVFCVSGCALGPNYKRPAVDAPADFRSAITPAEQASLADLPWWEIFRDETLQRLISEALQNNYDLRVAVTRVEQARQLAAQARGQFFPQIAYDGIVAKGKNSFLTTPSPNGGRTDDSALLDVNVFWEMDFWGRIRRLNESARAQYLASDEGRRAVVVSLVSAVAQAYFEVLELDLELEIAKRNTKSFEDTLRIFTQRLEGGVASKLETASADALVGTAAATIPELERQIVIKENQINVLLGCNPGPVERSTTLLEQYSPPDIPAGLPSALLERRPDIRQAEQNLRSANAQIGVAMANFFPKIGLTTLLGQVSPELSAFTAGTANLWAVAGTMSGPLFQGGTLVAQYRQAKAFWEESKLTYEQVALNAFQEVSNALISRQKLAATRAQQHRTVKSYDEAVQVSIKRYVAGKASYYEVLQNQQNLFPAENTLARTELNQLLAIVQLYKALGGGWQEYEPVTIAHQRAGD